MTGLSVQAPWRSLAMVIHPLHNPLHMSAVWSACTHIQKKRKDETTLPLSIV